MYIANSVVTVGGKKYRPGETVPAVEGIDKLVKIGYIIGSGEITDDPDLITDSGNNEDDADDGVDTTNDNDISDEAEGSETENPDDDTPADEVSDEVVETATTTPQQFGRRNRSKK